MMKANWLPSWENEGRTPAFALPEIANNQHKLHNPFGRGLHLWGNTPAIDTLNLTQNEGDKYTQDIEILFAGKFLLLFSIPIAFAAHSPSIR
jgi:hypothetical protein